MSKKPRKYRRTDERPRTFDERELMDWAGSHMPRSPEELEAQLAMFGVFPRADGCIHLEDLEAAMTRHERSRP